MHVTQTTMRGYEVHANGTIFTIDVTRSLSDDGTLDVTGAPHRTAYPPGSDLSRTADAKLKAMADAVWTEDVVAAHRAALSKPPKGAA